MFVADNLIKRERSQSERDAKVRKTERLSMERRKIKKPRGLRGF